VFEGYNGGLLQGRSIIRTFSWRGQKSHESRRSELSVSGLNSRNGRVTWIGIGVHVLFSKNRNYEENLILMLVDSVLSRI
jgi:hypothetical protein